METEIDNELLENLPLDLQGEIIENIMRKDYTEVELAEMQKDLKDRFSERTNQGERTDLKENGTSVRNHTEVNRTDERIAKIFREGQKKVNKRISVLEAARENPDEYGDLEEKLNNSVHSAYNEYQRRKEKKERKEKTRELPELKNLFLGDCLEKVSKIPDNSVDSLITDPPFGIGEETGSRTTTQELRQEEWGYDGDDDTIFPLLENLFKKLKSKLKKNSLLYIFTSWKAWHKLFPVVDSFFDVSGWIGYLHYLATGGHFTGYRGGLSSIMFAVNGKGRRINGNGWNFFDVSGSRREERDHHPAQKSIEICKKLIKNSTVEGETVCDPFAGSGSTLVAAEKLDRNWIGIEKEERWFKTAKSRILEVKDDV